MNKPNLKTDTVRVLDYLRDYITTHNGLAPTHREIAKACYMALSQVPHHLEILEALGYIRREATKARGIWLNVGDDM